jgi:hypothetical protein
VALLGAACSDASRSDGGKPTSVAAKVAAFITAHTGG